MNKLVQALLLVPFLSACSILESEDTHVVRLSFGPTELDEDYEPVDEPTSYGFAVHEHRDDTGWAPEFGVRYSKDDDDGAVVKLTLSTMEYYAGGRYTYGSGRLRPYGALGLVYLDAEAKARGGAINNSARESAFGAYAELGFESWISENLSIGAGARGTFGTELEDSGEDIDSIHLGVYLGWGF